MTNLLEETRELIKGNGATVADIQWVGSADGKYVIGWGQFRMIANVEYDNDYGAPEIAQDLVIVGVDWWMERDNHDGMEWWKFNRMPTIPDDGNPQTFTRVKVMSIQVGWCDIAELNSVGDVDAVDE